MRTGIARLSPLDLSNLRMDNPRYPFHFGGLAVVDSQPLVDGSGELRMAEIRRRLERRLVRVPELRRRVLFPGPLGGRPVWVDDETFDIANHVLAAKITAPGTDLQLLDAASDLYASMLDRGHPLWELWFLTGLESRQIGMLLKLHHAVADGMAAIAIMSTFFDFEPDADDPLPQPWIAAPAPSASALVLDNIRSRIRALVEAAAIISRPARLLRGARAVMREGVRMMRQPRAPVTSLNRPAQPGRRVRFLRVDLAAMKEVAHSNACKVNDVVLAVWAGGLRQLLTSRHELTDGLELITSVAVSFRTGEEARELGNRVGVITVPMPVAEPRPDRLLEAIAKATRRAKSEQHPEGVAAAMSLLAATPLVRLYIEHQRTINVLSTNLAGPPAPVYVLGARILEILPIVQVAGNVRLSICAFSYAGEMFLVLTTDAGGVPDIDQVLDGMHTTWAELSSARRLEGAVSTVRS